MLYIWHLKEQGDWKTIHKENDVIEILKEKASAKEKPKVGKHTC